MNGLAHNLVHTFMVPSGWILLTDATLSIPLQRHQQVKKSMYPVKYLLNKYIFFPLRMSSFLRTKSLHKHVYIPVVTPLFVSWNKRLCVLQLMSLQPQHPLLLCLLAGLKPQKELNLLGNNGRIGLCWLGQCDTVSIRLCKRWTICSSYLCVN